MAKKKVSKKAAKKKAPAKRKSVRKPAPIISKKHAKKTLLTKQDVELLGNRRVMWWFFGRLLMLAIAVYGILYMIFKDFKQGSAIILGVFVAWIIILLIKHRKEYR